MSFSRTWILLLLPLAGLPAAVYFFLRLKKKKALFPSLAIFGDIKTSEIVRVNFLRYVVIFLRCFFLALVITAFSRPYTDWRMPSFALPGGYKEDIDMVVLLDESYSMSAIKAGETIFRRAAKLAKEIVEELSENSRVAVVSFSGKVKSCSAFLTPREALSKMSSSPVFSYSGTDYSAALERAEFLLSGRSSPKKIILLAGDGAANGLKHVVKKNTQTAVFSPDFGAAPLNFWFDDVKVLHSAGKDGVSFEISGKVMASQPFSGTARVRYCSFSSCGNWRIAGFGKENSSSFKLSIETKENCGYLELSGDSVSADDRYYICANPRAKKTAFLYSGGSAYIQSEPAYFAREMFSLLKAENPFFDADFLEAETVEADKLSNYSMIFSFSVRSPEVLKLIAESGTPFFLVPFDPENDFSVLETLFSGISGRTYSGEFYLSGAGEKLPEFGEYELDRVYIKKFYALSNPGAVSILLSVKAGKTFYPAFFELTGRSSKSYAFSFSADLPNSNIVLKPLFMRILRQIAEKDHAGENSSFVYGAAPFPGKPRPSSVLSVSGKDISLVGGPEFKCEIPGVYRGKFGDETLYFSCNVDPASGESSLKKLDSPPWTLLPEKGFVEKFRIRAYKSELYDLLLILAAIVLTLENAILWKYF